MGIISIVLWTPYWWIRTALLAKFISKILALVYATIDILDIRIKVVTYFESALTKKWKPSILFLFGLIFSADSILTFWGPDSGTGREEGATWVLHYGGEDIILR